MNTLTAQCLKYLFVILLSFTIIPAQAQHIFDYANVIDPELVSQYDSYLSQVETDSGLRLEAVIIGRFNDNAEQETINYFLSEISSRQPPVTNSALLVVSLDDNYVGLFASESIAAFYPANIKDEIAEKVRQEISQENYPNILKVGLGGIVHYYNQNINKKKPTRGLSMMRDTLILLVLAAVFLLIYKFVKPKPPREI